MSLLDRVRRTVRQYDLAGPETRVVVALSGGSDSVALAHLVRELAAEGALRVAGVAHFNHGLRESADRDEHFSAALAESFGWPILTDREDVAARARRERQSVEVAARAARYAFFARVRAHLGADVVALGHTRDDQAETFLLRLLRGAGPRGLGAMHVRRGSIVRPLLDCRRHELRAYLDERHATYVEDESNQDLGIPRNRVRAELLPMLEARFNPAIVDVLADEAELARGEWQWMEEAAEQLEARTILRAGQDESVIELDVAGIAQAPVALRRLVVWRAMTKMARGRSVGFEHVQTVLQLVDSTGGTAGVDVPGQRVQRNGGRLVLTSRGLGVAGRTGYSASRANLFRYPLSIPGEVQLPQARCVLSVETLPSGSEWLTRSFNPDNTVAIVRSDVCQGGLAVRNRRPGDRFRPIGLGGQKKLQDYFVDRKVARADRDLVPLIVDEADRIVWVAGHGIDEAFRVTDAAQSVLILTLKQLGGPD